jgi:hypothetical protein
MVDVATVKVDTLTPLEGNPRRGDIEAVKRSLTAFGQQKPIVVSRATNEVIAGNHTLLAARALGWTEITVAWSDLTSAQAKAYAAADNRTHDLGDYDDQALLNLLNSLDEVDLDAAGYAPDDIDELRTFIAVMDAADNFTPDEYEPPTERLDITTDRVVVNVVVATEDRPKLYKLLKDVAWVLDARDAVKGARV